MSYPWRAAIFLLWPTGPALLLRTIPKMIALLIYPGLHFAEWIAGGFSSGDRTGYLANLVSGLIGLAVNFVIWSGLAYAALRSLGSNDSRS